jgi:hypothetical protein
MTGRARSDPGKAEGRVAAEGADRKGFVSKAARPGDASRGAMRFARIIRQHCPVKTLYVRIVTPVTPI